MLQNAVETQSAALAQVVLQVVSPQLNGAQVFVAGVAPQLPAPVQYAAGCSTPPTQVAVTHAVPVPGALHVAEIPSQVPAQVPVPPHAPCPGRGAPETSVHVPTFPDSLHDSHADVHARSQQIPTEQKPDAHCAPDEHVAPEATDSPKSSASTPVPPDTVPPATSTRPSPRKSSPRNSGVRCPIVSQALARGA